MEQRLPPPCRPQNGRPPVATDRPQALGVSPSDTNVHLRPPPCSLQHGVPPARRARVHPSTVHSFWPGAAVVTGRGAAAARWSLRFSARRASAATSIANLSRHLDAFVVGEAVARYAEASEAAREGGAHLLPLCCLSSPRSCQAATSDAALHSLQAA